MSFFMPNKLNPQGRKLLTIIITLPVFVSTSYILYKRLVLEEGIHKPVPRHEIAATNDIFAQYEKDMERDIQQQQQQQSAGSSSS
ncbi:hypothetical protein EDD21DRAFT_390357 [Dissophora ornata]|nr:hypothetical protein EDD21DRAFT_390357 [Dissophora ornata]